LPPAADAATDAEERVRAYVRVLRIADYRRLWTALVLNLLGDGATFVAMAWIVVERAGAAGLGVLGVSYTLPVLLGGAVVGPLLDRFSRRALLIGDAVVRGLVVAAIPLLAVLGLLQPWQIYVVAAVYGLLKIIPLAGTPAVLPELVPPEQLQAASALESTAMGVANIAGPAIGAALIVLIGAPNVLLLDAVTYFAFAALIARIRTPLGRPEPDPAAPERQGVGWTPAVRLVLRDRFLLFITASFAAFNVSAGALLVILPWLAKFEYASGPGILGLLLATGAVAELIGSLVSGAVRTSERQMVRVGLLQLLAGGSLLLLLPRALPFVLLALVLNGILTSPMVVLAGVVRLTRTPNVLRGRAMTLMRTIMSGALPAGSALGGALLAGGHFTALVVVVVALAAVPGALTALSFRSTSFVLGVEPDGQPAVAAS
jgi:predicted MFS family arabinose efflux permease